jgi:hypothetical protein
MTTEAIRQSAAKILDGMTFNKGKLARECIAMCDLVDRLSSALAQEKQKNATLQQELEAARATGGDSGITKDFADIFGGMFTPGKGN